MLYSEPLNYNKITQAYHEHKQLFGETKTAISRYYKRWERAVRNYFKEYELYISETTDDWGEAVHIGEFENSGGPQSIEFPDGIVGQYFRLVALSEVNGNAWSSAAEFTLTGCTDLTENISSCNNYVDIKAFPVPTNGLLTINAPAGKLVDYKIMTLDGKRIGSRHVSGTNQNYQIDLEYLDSGIYLIILTDKSGIKYRAKAIKQ